MSQPTTSMPNTPPVDLDNDKRFDLLTGTAPAKTISREGQSDFYVVGELARESGRKKVPQIFINCEVGPKDSKKFASIPLHEIPLVNRLNRHFGGVLEIITKGYAPGIRQVRWMTDLQAQDEYRRLAGDGSGDNPAPGAYMLPPRNKDDKFRNMFDEVYGTGRDGIQRFFEGIGKMALAWMELIKRVQDDMRPVNDEDIWQIIDIVDPRVSVASIEMPELPALEDLTREKDRQDAAAGEGSDAGELEPADFALVQYLTDQKVPDDVAKRFAGAVANAKGNDLSEKAWKTVLPDKDSPKHRKTLEGHLRTFLTTPRTAPQLQS